jgi:hypothetical protein
MIQQAMRDSPVAAAATQQQQQASGATPAAPPPPPQQQQQAQQPQPLLPLIRLRVDYSGFSTINSQRFGQKFVGKVSGADWRRQSNTSCRAGCLVCWLVCAQPATYNN